MSLGHQNKFIFPGKTLQEEEMKHQSRSEGLTKFACQHGSAKAETTLLS